jgi:hypothetical protein
MHRRLLVPGILAALGAAAAAAALLAPILGLDRSPGWGRARLAVLILGITLVLIAGAYARFVESASVLLASAVARLRKSRLARLSQDTRTWWDALSPIQKHAVVGAGFLAFFLLLLLPIPLSHSLLGPVDALFVPIIGNTYINRIEAALSGGIAGQGMHPADLMRYGETSPLISAFFALLRVLGMGDIHAFYLTQAIMLALTAFAALLFARHYTRSLWAAGVAALFFSTSNFIWANIDDLYAHFYFLPLLSAHFLKNALERGSIRSIMAAGITGGLQVYAAGQTYIYQTMLLGVILLVNGRAAWRDLKWGGLVSFAAVYLLIPLPRILYYLHTVNALGATDVWPVSAQAACFSLQPSGLLSSLPGKLITYGFVYKYEAIWPWSTWCDTRQLAFMGLGIPLLGLLSLQRANRPVLELLLLAAVGLLFALGPTVQLGDRAVSSPVHFFYKYFPLARYLRIALRSYLLSVLSFSILAALGLEQIRTWLRAHQRLSLAVPLLAVAFVLAENISWPLNRDETVPWPDTPAGYVEFFQDKPDAVILDLPSLSTSWPGYVDEIRFLLWQTHHKRNGVGGVFGYYPPTRMEAQHYTDLLPSNAGFQGLQEFGVTHFVWHDSPHLYSHPAGSLVTEEQIGGSGERVLPRDFSWLIDSPCVQRVFSNNEITIYELQRKDATTGNIPLTPSSHDEGSTRNRRPGASSLSSVPACDLD